MDDFETSEQLPLSPDEIAAKKFLDAAAAFVLRVWEGLSDAWDTFKNSEAWTFILAYRWACVSRPEWVKILNRTKKGRTRKKYQDKILRAYQASKEVE